VRRANAGISRSFAHTGKNGLLQFSSNVFDSVLMQERLPSAVYKHVRECIEVRLALLAVSVFKILFVSVQVGTPLSMEAADVIATALKDWAVSRGVTHYRFFVFVFFIIIVSSLNAVQKQVMHFNLTLAVPLRSTTGF
jgi:glutamine synthetase type III